MTGVAGFSNLEGHLFLISSMYKLIKVKTRENLWGGNSEYMCVL